MFRELGMLGAFLFFNRDMKDRNDPSITIKTLAFQLASYHPAIGEAISEVIEKHPTITDSAPLQFQFRKLLSETLPVINDLIVKPIIVVIDSLDECGDVDSREDLLSLLSREVANLPSSIRILITSRPEKDIKNAFDVAHVKSEELDVTSESSIHDVEEFLRERMAFIRKKHDSSPNWPGDRKFKQLALRANGLFIWASTACRFIDKYPPEKKLEIILTSNEGVSNPLSAVDDIYIIALTTASDKSNTDFWADFRRILGIILMAKVPLSIEEIAALLADQGKSCHRIISYLGSVLQDQNGVISTLHKSFHDFLTGAATQADPWHIDIELHNLQLAEHCIKLLNGNLKENICELTLTMDGFDATLPKSITYASLQWIEHVCAVNAVPFGFGETVYDLLSHHAMHWLEAMSLMRSSRIGIRLVQQLSNWIRKSLSHQLALQSLVHDLYRFSSTFVDLIEEHPLLIYSAALPFTPSGTDVYKLFYQSHMPMVKGWSVAQSWPPMLLTMASGGKNFGVAFSPDGARIVSGSDMTIRVWDATTGSELLSPFQGHTDSVWSVAFSPDGTRIVSGSDDNTIRVWDATTGSELLPPFEGHIYSILSVAFSPDGRRIVSGSDDKTIRVWDATTGSELLSFQGHIYSVRSVAFSPDGTKIVSGSLDGTIRVWDATTGSELPPLPFQEHIGSLWSLAFSPDGTRIVSGCVAGAIRVWDFTTGSELLCLFQEHTGPIRSVTFSPDGTRIVSGSDDKTIRVWDASTGSELVSPFQGHTGYIWSVAVSPDGTRFVSSSSDQTIRVWDATTGSEPLSPVQVQKTWLRSVAFSPDGTRIVTGSSDQTIRVWDVATGSELLSQFLGNADYLKSVTFSQDGTRIVSDSDVQTLMGEDQTFRVWDASSGQELSSYSNGSEFKELPLDSFTQIGRWIIHTDTGQVILQFPEGLYKAAEFGSMLAVAKDEKELLFIQLHDLCSPT